MSKPTNPLLARVKIGMVEVGISQTELAEIMDMDQPSLSRKLNGKVGLKLDEFISICAVLDLPADYFTTQAIEERRKEICASISESAKAQ